MVLGRAAGRSGAAHGLVVRRRARAAHRGRAARCRRRIGRGADDRTREALAPGIDRSRGGAWREVLERLGVTQPVEQAARDVVDAARFDELCEDIRWLDQTRMRAFLRGRGWHVPWLGRFFHLPEARRELFAGGPSAVLGLEWREEDGRVTPTWLAFESATEDAILIGDLPASWLSEIGRDVLSAAAAARV
jgi:hypothetical protein